VKETSLGNPDSRDSAFSLKNLSAVCRGSAVFASGGIPPGTGYGLATEKEGSFSSNSDKLHIATKLSPGKGFAILIKPTSPHDTKQH